MSGPAIERIAMAAGALAVPVAVWWLLGDQSEPGVAPDRRDYLVRPPGWLDDVVSVVGPLAVVVLAASIVTLVVAHRRAELPEESLVAGVLYAIAGVIVGAGGRVVTAGASGANTGRAIVLLVGAPLVLALVAGAAAAPRLARRRGPARPQ